MPQGLSDRRHHRLRQPDERVLVRAAGSARSCAPYYFQDVERLPQYLTEKVLRARMAALPSVESRFGWTARRDRAGRRAACASPSPRTAAAGARCSRRTTSSAATARIRSCASRSASTRGGADFDQLMVLAVFRSRELHEGLKRFPERATYNVLHPDLKGYWQFFGRIDVGEGFFFHAPVPAGHDAATTTISTACIQRAAGFQFACRIRPCRLLGSARRRRRDLSGRARVHRRRRRAQPSALRRLRPQQRPRRRGQSRLEARGDAARAGAATRCCVPTARNGGRSSRRPARTSSPRRIEADAAVARPLQPRARPGRVRARLGGAQGRPATRAHDLRAALRRLAGDRRAAGRQDAARTACTSFTARAGHHLRAAAAVLGQATCSRNLGRASRCSPSAPRTPTCGAFERRRARRAACRSRSFATRFDGGREAYERAARCWCGRISTSPGPATSAPDRCPARCSRKLLAGADPRARWDFSFEALPAKRVEAFSSGADLRAPPRSDA